MLKKIKKIEYKIKTYIMGKYIYLKNYKLSNPEINYEKINKLLFIAHPDDEVVFFYRELITEKGWLVVCITNGDNKVRLKEFINSVTALNCSYQIWDFEDAWSATWNRRKISKKIQKILKKKEWSLIATHNSEGEYGHNQHKQLNSIIRECCKNYKICTPYKNKDLFIQKNLLSQKLKKKKINHMMKNYKSQQHIITQYLNYFKYEKLEKLN